MACISKLTAGLAYDCDTGATGLTSALIINKEDIKSFTVDATNANFVTAITLVSGGNAYKVDTPKRTLVVSEALKVNEGAPKAFSQTATLTVTGIPNATVTLPYIITPFTNGSFVLLTRDAGGFSRVYGLYYGLSVSSIDRNTADNGGWYTITMSTPEQVLGEDALALSIVTYDNLYGAAVY